MPPRLNLYRASCSLAVRARPSSSLRNTISVKATTRRGYADQKDPKPATGPNQDVLGSVSEEAKDLSEVTGETPPDLNQGTPVQEILKRDQEGKDKAPGVIKDDSSGASSAEGTSFANVLALGQIENIAAGREMDDPVALGHKFGLPDLPIPSTSHMKHREDPIITQVTNLLMKDGKKSVAQRNMSYILNHLRTAPPPVPSPSKPLLPGSPPPSHLPLNPIQYLRIAIDSVAPLVRIRSQRGAAGGGASLHIPVPLGLKQRRRQAVQWILDAASKKKSRGSGRGMFAQRIADEIVNVVEGRSTAWERRLVVHKAGTAQITEIELTFNVPLGLEDAITLQPPIVNPKHSWIGGGQALVLLPQNDLVHTGGPWHCAAPTPLLRPRVVVVLVVGDGDGQEPELGSNPLFYCCAAAALLLPLVASNTAGGASRWDALILPQRILSGRRLEPLRPPASPPPAQGGEVSGPRGPEEIPSPFSPPIDPQDAECTTQFGLGDPAHDIARVQRYDPVRFDTHVASHCYDQGTARFGPEVLSSEPHADRDSENCTTLNPRQQEIGRYELSLILSRDHSNHNAESRILLVTQEVHQPITLPFHQTLRGVIVVQY
ncbi:hypothetical protein B7494_g2102 [Chlorociboria aeruginascens]|nr:hypothetical protein B7494_g2102 [Chlorociboria aeruginascens]